MVVGSASNSARIINFIAYICEFFTQSLLLLLTYFLFLCNLNYLIIDNVLSLSDIVLNVETTDVF
jgi:hypothetical protein